MKIAEQDILNQFTADKDLMTILTMIRSLQLKDSWLAAGSVRNFIWNYLSNQPGFDKETDVDVIFFDLKNRTNTKYIIVNKSKGFKMDHKCPIKLP